MNTGFIVTGTDTDLGKTVFAAALVHALGADYWKPVQAGLDGTTDTETVRELASLPPGRVHAECYRLNTPCSPHRAAELDSLEIDTTRLRAATPATGRPLVIEGAGGLLVPITRSVLQIDVFAIWNLPIILCTRTSLGTINHTLLSIEALRTRGIPLAGIAFIGDENRDTERTICEMGKAKRLGRLPWIDPLQPNHLHAAFADGFDIDLLKPATHHLEK